MDILLPRRSSPPKLCDLAHVVKHQLSSANSFSDVGKLRDLIAKKMAPDLLVEAVRRASVCMAFNYQDYD